MEGRPRGVYQGRCRREAFALASGYTFPESRPMESDAELLESVPLPQGVTTPQWQEEKSRWQNPRIRALLGCANILEAASESNQAILTCSPERLAEIWGSVRKVTHVMCD